MGAFLKIDISPLSSIFSEHAIDKSKKAGFGIKGCLYIPSIGSKDFNYTRREYHEDVYAYTDKDMRCFIRQSMKGGKVGTFKENFYIEHININFEILREDY